MSNESTTPRPDWPTIEDINEMMDEIEWEMSTKKSSESGQEPTLRNALELFLSQPKATEKITVADMEKAMRVVWKSIYPDSKKSSTDSITETATSSSTEDTTRPSSGGEEDGLSERGNNVIPCEEGVVMSEPCGYTAVPEGADYVFTSQPKKPTLAEKIATAPVEKHVVGFWEDEGGMPHYSRLPSPSYEHPDGETDELKRLQMELREAAAKAQLDNDPVIGAMRRDDPEWAFHELFAEQEKLMVRKQKDYGPGNIEAFGEVGLLVRLSDKINRLINLLSKDDQTTATDESIEDTWMDIANYGVIGVAIRKGYVFHPPKEYVLKVKA